MTSVSPITGHRVTGAGLVALTVALDGAVDLAAVAGDKAARAAARSL